MSNWDHTVVKSDRTKIIDYVVAEINSRDVTYNMTERELEEYIYHWKNMYRIVTNTVQGIKRPKWETIDGRPDHFAHATIYWRLAMEQTLSMGAIVDPPEPSRKGGHPVVSEDQTVPALNLKEIARQSEEDVK